MLLHGSLDVVPLILAFHGLIGDDNTAVEGARICLAIGLGLELIPVYIFNILIESMDIDRSFDHPFWSWKGSFFRNLDGGFAFKILGLFHIFIFYFLWLFGEVYL